MDLNDAIAELRRVTPADDPWQGRDLGPYETPELASPTDNAIATILNAVLSGQLLPLETCNARVDAMVEAAAADCDRMAGEIADAVLTGLPEQARIREGMEAAFTKAAARIRAALRANATDASEGER